MIAAKHRLLRTAKTTAVVLGFGVGGFAVSTAATSSWKSQTPMGASSLPDVDFGSKLSGVEATPHVAVQDGNVSISIWSDIEDGICVTAKWFSQSTTDTACSPASDIATGGVFISHLPRPDSLRLIVGIVSDGVAAVDVAGKQVSPTSNVWYAITDASVDSYAVSSADGSVRATMSLGETTSTDN